MDDRRRPADARRALTHSERAALSALLRDVGPRLHAYVRRAFPRGVDADDILAEVFARAAANSAGLFSAQRPDLYLLAAARNLCRDAHRRRRPFALDEESTDTTDDVVADPSTQSIEDEERTRLLAAVEKLPDALREVVVLRLSTDLTFDEISGIVGSPIGTVLSRMHHAVLRLRRNLGIENEPVVGK
jgi:RNA polymerase sigma factor (sigma-70 family)